MKRNKFHCFGTFETNKNCFTCSQVEKCINARSIKKQIFSNEYCTYES